MRLPHQVGAVLEHLEDQRTFIRDTMRQLNEQMALVERCIHELCLVVKSSQDITSYPPARDDKSALVDAGIRQ